MSPTEQNRFKAALVAYVNRRLAAQTATPWRDAQGIARHLAVDVKTVHRLTGQATPLEGRLPCHRLTQGGRKMFHRDEVDRWLLARQELDGYRVTRPTNGAAPLTRPAPGTTIGGRDAH